MITRLLYPVNQSFNLSSGYIVEHQPDMRLLRQGVRDGRRAVEGIGVDSMKTTTSKSVAVMWDLALISVLLLEMVERLT